MIANIPICPNCYGKNSSIKYLTSSNKFDVYFCRNCEIGFTHPIPKNIGNYYHSDYWISPGITGQVKDLLFKFFQTRRLNWVNEALSTSRSEYLLPTLRRERNPSEAKNSSLQSANSRSQYFAKGDKYIKNGDVLDVGSGEGNFGKNATSNLNVLSVDSKTAQIKNPDVKRINFLKWRNEKKFDAVTFWESLEHTTNPQAYLKKASRVLKDRGLIFIEYPRFNSLEPQIFGRHWFHLDVPRHSSHLTDTGLSILLKRANFIPLKQISVPAFEYTIWGFIASVLDIFEIKPTDKLKGVRNLAIIIALIPLAMLAFIIEVIFSIFHESPIGLMVARKK